MLNYAMKIILFWFLIYKMICDIKLRVIKKAKEMLKGSIENGSK